MSQKVGMSAEIAREAVAPEPERLISAETPGRVDQPPLITVVTPAYNEAENLPLLYKRLVEVLEPIDGGWEWLVIDDRSSDGTFDIVSELAGRDERVTGLRLARNSGSHIATLCGLARANGRCAIVLAADLQDPPETIPALLVPWRGGSSIVWAVRAARDGETARTKTFAQAYYWIMRHLVGLKSIPAKGADFFLVDRKVLEVLASFRETNVSLMALLGWMGFEQSYVEYVKQARAHGESGWSLEKKLKLVVDSVTAFTYLPIRVMSYLGFGVAVLGFLYAGFIATNAFGGHPVEGWSSLMVVVLLLGGMQMILLGVLGEYVWRSLDAARGRPAYLVDAETKPASESPGRRVFSSGPDSHDDQITQDSPRGENR